MRIIPIPAQSRHNQCDRHIRYAPLIPETMIIQKRGRISIAACEFVIVPLSSNANPRNVKNVTGIENKALKNRSINAVIERWSEKRFLICLICGYFGN